MEIAWSVVAVLFLVIVVLVWQWSSARAAAAKANTELQQAAQRANDAESRLESAESGVRAARDEARSLADRLKQSETTREAAGFDPDRVYKLLAKGRFEAQEGPCNYGVVQEDSGNVRSFLVDEALDHLEEGDCFGVLRGRLAKLSEDEFKPESAPDRPEPLAEEAPVTQMREAPQPDTGHGAPTQMGSQKTVLFVAQESEQPEDPNKGLPYLVVGVGDEKEQVYHLGHDRTTAGRGDDNAIILKDQNASRRHFTVSFTGNRFLLEDSDSTNGTLCNGEKVAQKWLEFGDRIEVGDTVIRFSCEGYDLKDEDAERAVAALEECVERQPDFIDALKLLAYMLERNVARKKEAASYWERISRLEAS